MSGVQLEAYRDILRRYGQGYDLMAFIDADEFLMPEDKTRAVD